jgi:hypothetical protein
MHITGCSTRPKATGTRHSQFSFVSYFSMYLSSQKPQGLDIHNSVLFPILVCTSLLVFLYMIIFKHRDNSRLSDRDWFTAHIYYIQ